MFDSKIVSGGASGADFEGRLHSIHNLLTTLSRHTRTMPLHAAPQEKLSTECAMLADRYGRASPLARRRAEALLHEAGIEGSAGLELVTARPDAARQGVDAAAAFLRRRLDRALRQVDEILPKAA